MGQTMIDKQFNELVGQSAHDVQWGTLGIVSLLIVGLFQDRITTLVTRAWRLLTEDPVVCLVTEDPTLCLLTEDPVLVTSDTLVRTELPSVRKTSHSVIAPAPELPSLVQTHSQIERTALELPSLVQTHSQIEIDLADPAKLTPLTDTLTLPGRIKRILAHVPEVPDFSAVDLDDFITTTEAATWTDDWKQPPRDFTIPLIMPRSPCNEPSMTPDELPLARISETASERSDNGDVAKGKTISLAEKVAQLEFECERQVQELSQEDRKEMGEDLCKVLTGLEKLRGQMAYVAPKDRRRFMSKNSLESDISEPELGSWENLEKHISELDNLYLELSSMTEQIFSDTHIEAC